MNIFAEVNMCVGVIWQFDRLPDGEQRLMRAAWSQMNLSARADHHILKLVRTIADPADCTVWPMSR